MEFLKEFNCTCGKVHKAMVDDVVIGNGVIKRLPEFIKKYSAKKVFIVEDVNTYAVAGKTVENILADNKIEYGKYVFPDKFLEPDEKAVGKVITHYDYSSDIIVGVGSGVINDISKILSKVSQNPYVIVATAPSMDGYASASSSMNVDGLKVSLPSRCANVVIGDIDILKTAPIKMLKSGLGDMLAKYVSILEWRISNLINGEYYCEYVANVIRSSVKKCVDNAKGLLKKDDEAIKAVFEGLVLGGISMNYVGVSRPASGVEHYFSHVLDMRGLEFKTPVELHGIQCAVGTNYALKIYEKLKKIIPNREKALSYFKTFDYDKYSKWLIEFLGKGALSMIELEKKEGKYDAKKHKDRLTKIIDNWNKILKIMDEELISSTEFQSILDTIEAPKTFSEIGLKEDMVKKVFIATKDIRDKYVLSRLCFDLGVIDQVV